MEAKASRAWGAASINFRTVDTSKKIILGEMALLFCKVFSLQLESSPLKGKLNK